MKTDSNVTRLRKTTKRISFTEASSSSWGIFICLCALLALIVIAQVTSSPLASTLDSKFGGFLKRSNGSR